MPPNAFLSDSQEIKKSVIYNENALERLYCYDVITMCQITQLFVCLLLCLWAFDRFDGRHLNVIWHSVGPHSANEMKTSNDERENHNAIEFEVK